MKKTPPEFRHAIIEYIREQAKPVDKFSHQERLYQLTHEIGAGMEYDDDVVFAAAWMHDLGVFIGHRPEDTAALANWDMLAYAMKEVPPILKQLGFPLEKIPAVMEAIRTHMPSSNPTSVEGTLLRDADILEQLGAAGILRNVSKVGRDTRFRVFGEILHVLQKNAETLPGQLNLDSSRELAHPRLRLLNQFLAGAKAENCWAGLP